jgi:hypothetical protein
MSQQKAKKLRKEYRKEVKQYMDSQGLLELFQLIVKTKPRWMPKWVWLKGIKVFIKVQEDWNYAGAKHSDRDKSEKTG